MLAGALGVLVLLLALLAARKRRYGIAAGARRVGAGRRSRFRCTCAANMSPPRCWRSLGEAILLFAALRWCNIDLARVGALTLAVIIFQALLGMWTVTWLLKPIVVMGHLLGGLTTFSLLTWMAWRATDRPIRAGRSRRRCAALGDRRPGAAGRCRSRSAAGSAPTTRRCALRHRHSRKCVGQWWPPHDFREGFVLWRGIGVDYEGGVLDGASRIAIQLAHRIVAVVVFVLPAGVRRCACCARRACAAGRCC